MSLIRETTPISRVERVCCGCSRAIAPGVRHLAQVVKDDYLDTIRLHFACFFAWAKWGDDECSDPLELLAWPNQAEAAAALAESDLDDVERARFWRLWTRAEPGRPEVTP